MIAQVILLREFLSVFNGNELVVGLVLANWMVLTGTGAILGKHQLNISKDSEVILTGLLILSVLPLITTFLINYLKNRIFPIGAMIDVFQMFIASLFLLIPFCFLSGFLFTYISRSYSEIRMRNEIGAVYGFESAGSIAGGLLSGLIFIFLFSSVESLLVMAILNGLSLFYLCSKNGLIRVQFEMSVEMDRELKNLMKKAGVRTKKDLFNNALTLLNWAIEERQQGCIIASIDEKKMNYKEVIMPVLQFRS